MKCGFRNSSHCSRHAVLYLMGGGTQWSELAVVADAYAMNGYHSADIERVSKVQSEPLGLDNLTEYMNVFGTALGREVDAAVVVPACTGDSFLLDGATYTVQSLHTALALFQMQYALTQSQTDTVKEDLAKHKHNGFKVLESAIQALIHESKTLLCSTETFS